MGSSACYHLARRGLSVLGLDQFSIPSSRGSSHGITRILRLGLHESEKYVPLVLRAVELWDELGTLSQEKIFHRIGSLDVALPNRPVFQGSLKSCATCGIEHEVLDEAELRRRFPALHPEEGMMGVHQPGSGFVLPEVAVCAHVNLALAAGAEIHGMERVIGWERKGGEYQIRTERDTYAAGQMVVTAGAWAGKILRDFGVPVEAERTVLGWFSPVERAEYFTAERLPVWIVDSQEAGHFYGFPTHGVPGFKLGRLREHPVDIVDPDLLRREPDRVDEADMRSFLRQCFPDANGPVLSMQACFFENSPDRAPIIDELVADEGLFVVGGFSGHGFKYASVMGEIVADLVERREQPFDLSPFSLKRFALRV